MKKYTKGFTLLELLITIAIIGIITTVVMVSLTNTRRKGDDSAFKKEVSSKKSALILACDSGALVEGTDLAAAGQRGLGTINDQNCGTGGNGTFDVTIPVKANFGGNCTSAIVTEKDISFVGC